MYSSIFDPVSRGWSWRLQSKPVSFEAIAYGDAACLLQTSRGLQALNFFSQAQKLGVGEFTIEKPV